MLIKTYKPFDSIPEKTILPQQNHGIGIVEIVTGSEDLFACDGIWTRDFSKILGIKTADCAAIAFWQNDKFGILHAGWRGLCAGIIEKMLENFEQPQIFVGPLYPKFKIQKDSCYHQIKTKFGTHFFSKIEGEKSFLFDFISAIHSIVPNARFDSRSTFHDFNLASWRRDFDEKRNITIISGK